MEILTIQMTPDEYEQYRSLSKAYKELEGLVDAKQSIIESTRDMYSAEFKHRMTYQGKIIAARNELDKAIIAIELDSNKAKEILEKVKEILQ